MHFAHYDFATSIPTVMNACVVQTGHIQGCFYVTMDSGLTSILNAQS